MIRFVKLLIAMLILNGCTLPITKSLPYPEFSNPMYYHEQEYNDVHPEESEIDGVTDDIYFSPPSAW